VHEAGKKCPGFWTLLYSTVHYNTGQCSTVQHSTCTTAIWNTVPGKPTARAAPAVSRGAATKRSSRVQVAVPGSAGKEAPLGSHGETWQWHRQTVAQGLISASTILLQLRDVAATSVCESKSAERSRLCRGGGSSGMPWKRPGRAKGRRHQQTVTVSDNKRLEVPVRHCPTVPLQRRYVAGTDSGSWT